MHQSNTKLMQTPLIFEWYMARLVGKNKYQRDTCYNNVGRRAQNKDSITIGRGLKEIDEP
jgi:hypothetical protein